MKRSTLDTFLAKDVIHKPSLYKALHYFYNDSRTKNGFPFCGDGFVTDTVPIFYQYKIPPPYRKYDDGNRNDIVYHSGIVVTTLPQAGYAYIIA